jgi:simple sugar transport system permease protein
MTKSISTEAGRPAEPKVDHPDQASLLHRAMARPEVGAFIAAVGIFIFFTVVATPFHKPSSLSTVLYASATIGIVAVAVTLLMIGGEFDLSAGVAATTASLTASMLSFQYTLNMWVGVVVSLVLALGIGFVNGYLVVRTGIPSFLVTLGSFFILQGANLGVTKLVTGSVSSDDVSNIAGFESARKVFSSSFDIGGVTVKAPVVWWLLFVAIATWILVRTRIGNWIFAVGGNADSARAVGVPVARVKIGLFMTVGFMCWFYGMHILFAFNTIQAGTGLGDEFLFIIAAVVGGTLLTGGYGSAVGGAIGAFIFGMTEQGIVYAGWDPNWFKTFLGVMLLLAVAVNLIVRKLATSRRK